jgi:hypothetical protein
MSQAQFNIVVTEESGRKITLTFDGEIEDESADKLLNIAEQIMQDAESSTGEVLSFSKTVTRPSK